MCGIIGVCNSPRAGELVAEGLKILEYRGYDSWGIAAINGNNLEIQKDVGVIPTAISLEGSTAIGHVRWATHGGVTKQNAHPHLDCTGSIAIVHNGVLENHVELKAQLQNNGHKFSSETDTEVISHLLESFNGIPLENAMLEALKQLKGSYALLAASHREPSKLVAAKKESPLVIAKGNAGMFAASDTLPLSKHATSFVPLEDGEIAILENNVGTFLNSNGEKIEKKFQPISWKADAAELGSYRHFMEKEINECPAAFANALKQNIAEVKQFATDIKQAKRVVFVACGTARHAAIIGRYLFNKIAGKFCEVMIGSEFQYFAPEWNKDTLVIAVSQSGETADVLVGIREAKAKGARVYSVVNVEGSSLARESDKILYIKCGPEIGVAATKSFIAKLAVLYLVAFAMAEKLGQAEHELSLLPGKIQETFNLNSEKTKAIAEKIKNQPSAYFIARAINFAIATEGALKLKEISYIHAEGMPAGELKHGTLALISSGTPVIAINPNDYTHAETITNIMETKARGAHIIGVSDEANAIYDDWLKIPKVAELYNPIVSIIPLFQLAYHTACLKGLNADRPRNLAKSCTVR